MREEDKEKFRESVSDIKSMFKFWIYFFKRFWNFAYLIFQPVVMCLLLLFKLFRIVLVVEVILWLVEIIANFFYEFFLNLSNRLSYGYRLLFKGGQHEYYGIRKNRADFSRVRRLDRRKYKKAIAGNVSESVWVISK